MATVTEFEHGEYAIGGTEVDFPPFAWAQCTWCEQRIRASKTIHGETSELQSSQLPRVPGQNVVVKRHRCCDISILTAHEEQNQRVLPREGTQAICMEKDMH
jgi:hypothetical protein